MNEDEKKRLMQWYENENQKLALSGEVYDLRNEMKKHCYDNCYVLSTAFSRFNESMMNELVGSNVKGIVPHQFTIFHNATTIGDSLVRRNGYASKNTCNSSSQGIRQWKVWFIKRKGVVDMFRQIT